MHCQRMLLLTFSSSLLFLLSGPTCVQLSSAAENALENAFEPSRDEGDLQAQRFSASGGRALEVSTNQQQPVLRQQPQRPSYTLLQQQPTLELRPFFFSDHFLRQVPPVASFGVNSKYGGDRQRAVLYKPIRELVPVSSSFLSRGDESTLRARRYTYPTASQSFLRFGRDRYKRPKETKDTAFLRFGRSADTRDTSPAINDDNDDEEQMKSGNNGQTMASPAPSSLSSVSK